LKVYLAVEEQYFDYADLGSPLAINVPLGITNNEDIELYFKALLESPPEGYSDYEKALGAVGAGSSKMALFSFSRDKPTAEAVEELFLRLIAYTDPDYTTPYGSLTAKIRLHLIDHNDPSWDVLVHDDFDDGTTQGWDLGGPAVLKASGSPTEYYAVDRGPDTTHYISAPYAYSAWGHEQYAHYHYKDIEVGSGYKEAVFIVHIYCKSGADYAVFKLGNKIIFDAEWSPLDKWVRLALPLPTGQTTRAAFQTQDGQYMWIDEVFALAR